MGIGCQRNGHRQRPIICQVVACAVKQGVVVCGRAVCRKGCALIRQLANTYGSVILTKSLHEYIPFI